MVNKFKRCSDYAQKNASNVIYLVGNQAHRILNDLKSNTLSMTRIDDWRFLALIAQVKSDTPFHPDCSEIGEDSSASTLRF